MAKEVQTSDSMDYEFHEASPASSKCTLRFKVKAAHDAHICLSSSDEQDATPIIEVFLGGWDNSKCAIRRDRTKPDRAEAETPDVLNGDESRGFWICWDAEGKIEVGRDGEEEAFMSYTEPEPFEITHYGVRTAWGANGDWEIDGDLAGGADEPGEACWVPATNGELPDGAVVGGSDLDCDLYVARATHEGELLPGKFVPSHGVAYVSWDGAEHSKEEYEVLCGCKAVWHQINEGDAIPENALPGGRTADGETLFVGRVPHENTVTLGKVHPSHGNCYIPFGGAELGFPEFEVLVRQ